MVLGFLRRQSRVASETPAAPPAFAVATADDTPVDASRAILDLLEVELGGLIRQLERAAHSVADGAQSTATTLSDIRARTDALTGRTSSAQETATTFSQAADKFTSSARGIGAQVRNAGQLADEASAAAEQASIDVQRLRESSAAIGDVVNLIATIARQTTMLALNSTIEAARAGAAGRGFAVVAAEVKALAVQTQDATQEIRKKIAALQHDAASSSAAMQRIASAIEAIRPVFDHVDTAVAEQTVTTTDISNNAAAASQFIVSVGESAAEIDHATRAAETHGDSVARAGEAVTLFATKLKTRCAVLLNQGDRAEKRAPLPCHLRIELALGARVVSASVYEISREGLLIGGDEAKALREGERLAAVLESVGSCRLHLVERTPAGLRARFEAVDAAMRERIEDVLFTVHDENTEFVTRGMEAGARINAIFKHGIASGVIALEAMFDEAYVEIAGSNPLQHRTGILEWADRALPQFQDEFLATDPRMVFCAAIDRNGYLPVHNRIYAQPQRPGDVAYNTANCRNRRIFADAAGLAAGRNERPYLIQSYARDMGNGVTVMMREIDVPIRVRGRHWGGFRNAYKL